MMRMRINLENLLGRSSILLVDLCTLGYAYFSTAHAQNGGNLYVKSEI